MIELGMILQDIGLMLIGSGVGVLVLGIVLFFYLDGDL
jgi:hypothetical protein